MIAHGNDVQSTHGRNRPQQEPHDRVKERIPQAGDQDNGARDARGQAEHIRVEVRLEQDHGHEDEVRGGVTAAVPRLFNKREFLGAGVHLFHNGQNGFLQILVA